MSKQCHTEAGTNTSATVCNYVAKTVFSSVIQKLDSDGEWITTYPECAADRYVIFFPCIRLLKWSSAEVSLSP